jgi:hypothetical protein
VTARIASGQGREAPIANIALVFLSRRAENFKNQLEGKRRREKEKNLP